MEFTTKIKIPQGGTSAREEHAPLIIKILHVRDIFFITYNTESIMYTLFSVRMMKTGIRLAWQGLPVSAVEVFRSSFVLHSNHAVDKSF